MSFNLVLEVNTKESKVKIIDFLGIYEDTKQTSERIYAMIPSLLTTMCCRIRL